MIIPDTSCKRTWDSTASLHRTETFSDRQDQAREITSPGRKDQVLLHGSPQFTDHEHAAWTRPPRSPKQSPRQAGSPRTTPTLALGEFSFGYIHTLSGNTIPGSHRGKPGSTLQHLARGRQPNCSIWSSHREMHKLGHRNGPAQICPISSKQTPMAPSRALNEAMHFHKGGCPLMNESGGGTNHSWLLSTRKKEMLLGENYSLCSSYLTILQARSHPTINMLAASWRSSQAWARAIRGKTQLWGWG